jgi:hypothetical protein
MTLDMTGYEHIESLMKHEEGHRERGIAYFEAEAAKAPSERLRQRCLEEAERLRALVFPWEQTSCGCGKHA